MMNRAPRAPGPTSRDLMMKSSHRMSMVNNYHPQRQPAPSPSSSTPVVVTRKLADIHVRDYKVLSNFLYPEEQLRNTPSRQKHGIPMEEEQILKRIAAFALKETVKKLNNLINDKRLRLSVRALNVAMIYFHRFFMYHSLGTFHPIPVITACLHLAAKCEECPQKMSFFSRNLAQLMCYEQTDIKSDEDLMPYTDLITTLESCILRTLAFELKIDLPHVEIINVPDVFPSSLRKQAYRFSTDVITYTSLCLQYDAKTLAAACFYMAGVYMGEDMKQIIGEEWWKQVAPNLDEPTLKRIVKIFSDALEEVIPLINAGSRATQRLQAVPSSSANGPAHNARGPPPQPHHPHPHAHSNSSYGNSNYKRSAASTTTTNGSGPHAKVPRIQSHHHNHNQSVRPPQFPVHSHNHNQNHSYNHHRHVSQSQPAAMRRDLEEGEIE